MTIRFNNYSMLVKKEYENDRYEWCVFVDEDSHTVNGIRFVEYTLHPSFPDPVRLAEDKSTKFALFSSGWGTFRIKIRITLENGDTSTTSYNLRLAPADWPLKQAPGSFVDAETKLVYEALFDEKYRWRKVETIVKRSGLAEDRVLSILADLEKENLVRKALFLSIEGKEMWAATDIVGVAPKNLP